MHQGYCASDLDLADIIRVDTADDNLFQQLLTYRDHVLATLLPNEVDSHYHQGTTTGSSLLKIANVRRKFHCTYICFTNTHATDLTCVDMFLCKAYKVVFNLSTFY